MAGIRNISLTTRMFISMLLAIAAGFAFGDKMIAIKFIGDAWLSLLKMCIGPFILVVLVSSIGGAKNPASIGKTATRILMVYVFTTIVACIVGITTASIVQPGAGFSGLSEILPKSDITKMDLSFKVYFSNLFADNFIRPFLEGKILQIVVISVLMGIAVLKTPEGEIKAAMLTGIAAIQGIFTKIITMIIFIGPIGIFCLMSAMVGTHGQTLLGAMAGLIGTIYLGNILHVLICYVPLVWIFARINPIDFIKRSLPLCIYTCSTCSSVASIPVNQKTCVENFGVEPQTAAFTIPLGSQINMDSNGVFYPCILLFIAQATGVQFDFFQLLQMVIFCSLMASSGGGLPGSGIVKILVVVEAFGFPAEFAALVASFYAALDMGLTTVACWGDLTGTVIVDRLNKRDAAREAALQP